MAQAQSKSRKEFVESAAYAIKPEKPKRRDFMVLDEVDEDAYSRATKAFRAEWRVYVKTLYGDSVSDEDLNAVFDEPAAPTSSTPNPPLPPEVELKLITSEPVDPYEVQREVNAGLREPGVYLDSKGQRWYVGRE
jgi:hypothetical protein